MEGAQQTSSSITKSAMEIAKKMGDIGDVDMANQGILALGIAQSLSNRGGRLSAWKQFPRRSAAYLQQPCRHLRLILGENKA
jgi:hypothetical protein